jgi:hypothetical protein
MGESSKPVAVADAGPLIHLHEIGRLPLLVIFSRIHIAGAVQDEAVARNRVQEAELDAVGVLQRHEVLPADVEAAMAPRAASSGLHQGEI